MGGLGGEHAAEQRLGIGLAVECAQRRRDLKAYADVAGLDRRGFLERRQRPGMITARPADVTALDQSAEIARVQRQRLVQPRFGLASRPSVRRVRTTSSRRPR